MSGFHVAFAIGEPDTYDVCRAKLPDPLYSQCRRTNYIVLLFALGVVGMAQNLRPPKEPGCRPGVDVGRFLRVGTWNVLIPSEDHRLLHLKTELRRLSVDIVGLSEMRRSGFGKISSQSYTYHWFGTKGGTCLRGVAVGIVRRLQFFRC